MGDDPLQRSRDVPRPVEPAGFKESSTAAVGLTTPTNAKALGSGRWLQLAAGIIAMVAVSNLQYGWTLFVGPIRERFGWEPADIQFAFSIFVAMETWLVPFEVYLADRWGSRPVVLLGGALAGVAWIINAYADQLVLFYLGNALAGAGAGMVYGTAIGSALKWFPDRRGLAAGLTAMAWGAGSALTVWPMQETIEHFGYQAAFLWFGVGQALVVMTVALWLRTPHLDEIPEASHPTVAHSTRNYTPMQALRAPCFWVMYVMFVMVGTGGLLVIAQIAPMAKSFGVADKPVYVFGLTMTALTLAMSLDRILNGITRPFFGAISDRIGREKTMLIAFGLEGFAIFALIELAHVPELFVILTGLTFFAWGEAYSLFPALTGDLFGRKYASTNYGLLYTAKGMASLLVPIGSLLYTWTGSWAPIFYVAIVFDWTAALLGWFVLRPMRQRWMAAEHEPAPAGSGNE